MERDKNKSIGWVCLIVSGFLEIVWAYFLKQSCGFTVPVPTAITIFVLIVGFFLLERAISTFGIGLSYAVFTGIGIAGTTIVGIAFLDEGATGLKMLFLGILMVGIIGIRLADKREDSASDGGEAR